jgi:hypothetical protein
MKIGRDRTLILFILLSLAQLFSAVLLPHEHKFFTDLQSLNPQFQPRSSANPDLNDPCSWQEVICENRIENTTVVTEL